MSNRRRSVRRLLSGLGSALLASTCLSGCEGATRKLDEAAVYGGPQFRLKVVRYYENLPFHYTGEVFRVQCSSRHTTKSPGHKTQEAGWVTLGGGGAIGSKSATDVAERERSNYLVVNDHTLVWVGNGLNVSFDACGRFRGWYPTSLPTEMIIPVEKPDYCAPKGSVDCRQHDFVGERAPQFEDIRVAPSGEISFVVRSKAFRDSTAIRVRSTDFGRTWRTESP